MSEKDVLALARIRRMAVDGSARATRLAADVTHREIGDRCGVTPSTVMRWERGERVPHGRAALRYASLIDALDAMAKATPA